MATNIEIKARLRDFSQVAARAAALSAGEPQIIPQEDIFFNTAAGRLKLRILAPGRAELIYYERPDAEGPKASDYEISRTDDPAGLRRVLAGAFGERGVVRKVRQLFLVGRTRVHLDRVEGLGDFMELEVVMSPGENPEQGVQEAHMLMAKLGINTGDLVEGAYIDLLEQN